MKDSEPTVAPESLTPVAETPNAGSVPEVGTRAATLFRELPSSQSLYPCASLALLGLLGIYLKSEMMDRQWGLAARLTGKTAPLDGFERLGFYFDDLLTNLLLIPSAGVFLALLLPRALRTVFFAGITLVAALLYFIELRAYAEVGQYVSAPLLMESLVWARSNPEALGDYVSLGSLFKLSLFLSLLLFLAAGLFFRCRSRFFAALTACHRALILLLAVGLPASALVLLPLSYVHRPEGIHLQKSAVARVLAGLVDTDGSEILSFRLPLPDLLEEFRRQTATPPLDSSHPLVGAEAGADILLFVMETAPARLLDLVAEGGELPGIGRLYGRSFVGREHYTTYPYTSDALYSLLSGLYPQGRRQLLEQKPVRQGLGFLGALDPVLYFRAVYAPSLYSAEVDDRMYTAFGAEKTYYASDDSKGELRRKALMRAKRLLASLEAQGSPVAGSARQKLAERLVLDLQALERMKRDILEVKRAGRRFCVLFTPQIGHGPWIDLHGRGEVSARGRDLVLLQDLWLGEVLDLLATHSWLDSTIVVFTADHGVRTRAEDPDFDSGRLSADMLRVPLLIHAPRALGERVVLEAPTSHIDIAPTLLALLGETSGAGIMQGIPVWQRSEENLIFLLGSGYAGADGFVQGGVYVMHHLTSDMVFESGRLAFGDEDGLPAEGGRGDSVRRRIRQGKGVQFSIVRALIGEGDAER